jgi:hypothetical protein
VSAAWGREKKVLIRPSGTHNIFLLCYPGLGSARVAEPSFVAARVGPKGSTYDSWSSHSGLKERGEGNARRLFCGRQLKPIHLRCSLAR